MSSEISKFIKNLPVPKLQKYFEAMHKDLVEEFDWSLDEKLIKKSLSDIVEATVGEKLALLTSQIERVNSLTDELGRNILQHSIRDEEFEEYSKLFNEFDRSLWLFLKDALRFSQAEDSWYTDTRRQGQMWDGFIGPENIVISKDESHLDLFKSKLMEFYKTTGKIQVDIYERTRLNNEDDVEEIIQVIVYREDLPTSQLAFEDDNVVNKIVRPVKEVALTYEPVNGYIEIIAEGPEHRAFITKTFAEILLQSPIQGEKIPLKQYSIQRLLKNVTLSHDPEDSIEYVKVTMLKVARVNSYNSVTLDVATRENLSIYKVSENYFGNNDPLQSGFRLKQVRISIKFLPDDENRRGKMLHVKISEPNSCDLKSKSQKEKLIGEKYLKRWELVNVIQ